MSRSAPVLAVGLLCLGLVNCAQSGGGIAAGNTYDLVAPRSVAAASRTAPLQLQVYEPVAIEHALSGKRLMVRPGPAQVSYYKDVAWRDRLPRLVQARMIESFENSGAVKSASATSGQIGLATELRAFEVDVSNGRAASKVDILARLTEPQSGRVIATRGFKARVPAATDNPEDVVAALNRAFAKVQRDMIAWVTARRR